MVVILSILRSALVIMTPLLFAAIGGLFPALAGTLNIALEGLLLAGAFSGLAAFYYTGNIAAAITAAVITSLLLSGLIAYFSFSLRSNIIIIGLAANLLSGGICVIFSERLFGTKGVIAPGNGFNMPEVFPWYLYVACVLLLLSWVLIYKTPFGYRLRACDKHSIALVSLGIKPDFYRFTAFMICGLYCGIGGSFLSLYLGAFVPGMSAGKGWIALVIIFLGSRRPRGVLAAAFIFAFAEAVSNHVQGFWRIPADFILAFPFICTLVAMIFVSIKAKFVE
ncbi:MAG: ABC transporter permease [Treponema sp.]|nr:ABC transporter permease [Treponema sp.]